MTGRRRDVTKVIVPIEVTAEVVEEPLSRHVALVPILRRDEDVKASYGAEQQMPSLRLGDGDSHRPRRGS